jgi:hypothetical protein
MMPGLADLLVLALASAVYPTLLAVSVLLLNTPNPRPLLLGYLAGALTASIACGLAIVFALSETDALDNAGPRASPLVDVIGGGLILVLGWAVATGRVARMRGRRRAGHPKERRPSWTSRMLSRGSPSLAFGVAIVLSTIPGLYYLVGLKDIADGGYGVAVRILLVVAFNLVQFALIEIPLVAYALAPESTAARVDRFDAALRRNRRTVGTVVCLVVGLYLIARGVAGLAS